MPNPNKDTYDLPEALAALAHEQWIGWMEYQFSKGTFNEDGTWTMPVWAVKRWKRQMNTPYDDLPEAYILGGLGRACCLEAPPGRLSPGRGGLNDSSSAIRRQASGGIWNKIR